MPTTTKETVLRNLLLAALSAFTVGTAYAEGTADMEIYVDYPIGYWDITSTGYFDISNSGRTHSYENAMWIDMNEGDQTTLAHTWLGEYTKDMIILEFWVNPSAPGLAAMTINARIQNQGIGPTVRLGDYASPVTGQWTRVLVPLSHLGIQQGDVINSFYLNAPQNLPPFWADDIKMRKENPPQTTIISIDPGRTIRSLERRMFGVGLATQDWTIDLEETRQGMREAGILFMNFPGGMNANQYDWVTSTDKQDGTYCRVTTEDYLRLADAIGSDKMITANYGSGTPSEVAAWVRYANIEKGGDVIFWSIGNESYHPGAYDVRPPPFDHDAETYAAWVIEAIARMKAVDPRVKIGIVGTYGEHSWPQRTTVINPISGLPANGWSAVILTRMREAGVLPDYFDFHLAPTAPGKESDAAAFQALDRIDFWTGRMRKMLQDYLGPAAMSVPLNLTESNTCWARLGKQSTSLTSALYLAYSWGQLAVRNVDSFVWWKLHNQALTDGNFHPSLYGWRNYGDFGILARGLPEDISPPLNTPYPTFYAVKMLKLFARPGDTLVPVESNNMHLKVFASKSGGRVKLLVINTARDRDVLARLKGNGMNLSGTVTLHKYGRPEDANEEDIKTSQVDLDNVNFVSGPNLEFERYSMTVVEF